MSLDPVSIKHDKILIYLFELLSGLSINFYKSSLYQLGLPNMDLSHVVALCHCNTRSFPFTYLGLPLKPIALSKTDWQSLIDRIEKTLTG